MSAAAIALAMAAPFCLWRARRARRRLEARARALVRTFRSRYPQRWDALPDALARGAWPEVALQRALQGLEGEQQAVRAALAPLRRPLRMWLALSALSVSALALLTWLFIAASHPG